jgi:dipeptidyl aminopeptidase/acylaminoacyl peptidase
MSYPFLHADKIKTPTLFMGGEKDFNVTLVGGEQMYQALKSVGTTAELVVYPGQFHRFTRPSLLRIGTSGGLTGMTSIWGCLRRRSLLL